MASPVLSTVVLNWNRAYLLQQTLESYFSTVNCLHELWIVDNASSDDSRAVIERFLSQHAQAQAIFLPENRGGEAYNEVLPKLSGDFIYLSENDQLHLPGWCEHALRAFETYPRLGQLSLHAPVPTDAEAWVSKKVQTRFKNGCLLYPSLANVGTSSVIRGQLFEKGLALHNLTQAQSDVKFPDDIRLSRDIKEHGFWSAYSDRYYVRNIGHEAGEIEQNPDYYRENYSAKPAIGMRGLQQRVDLQRHLSRVQRQSHLFPGETLAGDMSTQAEGQLNPRFWSMLDGRTPEVEALELIHALVRAAKPQSVLETGGWLGHTAIAIAGALKANGLGRLTVLERDANAYAHLAARVAQSKLDNIDLRAEKSERMATGERYDFVIFDSTADDAEEEFFHILPQMHDRATVVFVGTREHISPLASLPVQLETLGLLKGQHIPTPRGLYVGAFTRKPEQGPKRIIFCLSAGRSGTGYLSDLIKGLPGLISLHEPEPKYQWQTLGLQESSHPRDFIQKHKLPWLRQLPWVSYFEASHYVQNGFLEAWMESGFVPDVILLTRDPRKIALSWYALGADFHSNRNFVLQHMLHPNDARPLFLPLKDWQSLNDYQLCYWYALECQERAEHYAHYLSERGGRVFETSLEALSAGRDLPGLLAWLDIALAPQAQSIIAARATRKVNHKQRHKNPERLKAADTLDFDALEAEVRARCG